MIALENHPDGVVLPVRAQPGASRNGLLGEHQGQLKVAVTQAPEKGKANKAIIAVLAKTLGLRKSQFTLISGDTAQQKRFLVEGISRDELTDRLASL